MNIEEEYIKKSIPYYNKAIRFLNKRNHSKAEKYIEYAIQEFPCGRYTSFIQYNKAIQFLNKKDYSNAEKCIEYAIQEFPCGHYYCVKGIIHKKQGHFKKAIECYDEAQKLNPELSEVHVNRGITNYKLKRYSESIDDFIISFRVGNHISEGHIKILMSAKDKETL